MSEVIVDLQHVSKAYGSTTVLKDINIEIEQGKFYTLLGPSGSGKTTILRAIAGFLDVTEGSFEFKRSAGAYPVIIEASSNMSLMLDLLRVRDEEAAMR